MKKILNYIQDSYKELVHKVSWPSWSELQSSAIVVMIAAVVIALLVFVMDFSFQNILEFVYKIFI
jgi:preprotein translocase subunit SecE